MMQLVEVRKWVGSTDDLAFITGACQLFHTAVIIIKLVLCDQSPWCQQLQVQMSWAGLLASTAIFLAWLLPIL
jgi:hypothetical protein